MFLNPSDGTLGFTVTGMNNFDDFSSSGSGIDWQSVINQGFGVGSQIIAAWGKNPSQQIGVGLTGYGGGYSPAAINQSQAQIQAAIAQQAQANQQQLLALRGTTGNGIAENSFATLTNFVKQNTGMVILGCVGLFLLMREPPKRR